MGLVGAAALRRLFTTFLAFFFLADGEEITSSSSVVESCDDSDDGDGRRFLFFPALVVFVDFSIFAELERVVLEVLACASCRKSESDICCSCVTVSSEDNSEILREDDCCNTFANVFILASKLCVMAVNCFCISSCDLANCCTVIIPEVDADGTGDGDLCARDGLFCGESSGIALGGIL